MSRHRAVRNLDLDAELADDFGEEADYLGASAHTHPDDLSPEDQQAMEDALATMQDDLGSQQDQFTERQMREALYETYFDVPGAIALLVQEKEKAEALAKKRAGTCIPGEGAKAPKVDGLAARTGGGKRAHPQARERVPDAPVPHEAQEAARRADDGRTRPASSNGRLGPSEATPPALGPPAPTAPAAPPAAQPPATAGAAAAAAPPKKLSKLQQKMQAAKAKQAQQASAGIPPAAPAAAASPAPAATEAPGTPPRAANAPSAPASGTSTPLRTPAASRTASPQPPAAPSAPTTAPSGEPLATLFPPRASALLDAGRPRASASPFVQLLERPVEMHPHTMGAKPVSDDEMQRLRAAFASLSPDDVVLQARRGTRLAQ